MNSALRLKPGSISALGPVCSSWVFLSRSSSGRSCLFPLGLESERAWVKDANIMNARVCVLLLILTFGHCTFLLEQPISSVFNFTPAWRSAMDILRNMGVTVWKQSVHLGAFGGLSQKTVKLYSNNRKLLCLLYKPLTGLDRARFVQHKLVVRHVTKAGRHGVTGIPAALRQSQSEPQRVVTQSPSLEFLCARCRQYPREYAETVAASHLVCPLQPPTRGLPVAYLGCVCCGVDAELAEFKRALEKDRVDLHLELCTMA